MKRSILAIVGLLITVALLLYSRRPVLPQIPARRVTRADLVQRLSTNGKIEALYDLPLHVRAPTLVRAVNVREGDAVRKGQLLAAVDDTAAREAVARARAQLDITRADLGAIERGGTPAELTELESAIARARLDREAAEREIASLLRLVERQAAPRADLADQQQKLRRAQAELDALDRKRKVLVSPEDRQRLQARIRQAEIELEQAATNLQMMEIRSPSDGILYTSNLRAGAFFNAGELIGHVGVLDKVRVLVLVDEPELGRVQVGQDVQITWDALPGRSWKGAVERLPSEISMVGSRSVGEVLCTLENPERRLLPNVTVNVDIKTGEADGALTVPREAVSREEGKVSVLVVDADGVVNRRPVKLGIQDATQVQVVDGLSEGQVVLLPGDRVLKSGERVEPQFSS